MTTNILIIGPSWVGDMVMAQTLFKQLHKAHPDLVLDVLAPEWTFALLSRMPEVSASIALPVTHGELKLKARYQLAKSLRAHHYDQAIILPNSFKSALIPWLARIPKRTGFRGECRYVLLNDMRVLDKQRYPLMIEQFMALGLAPNMPLPTPYLYPEFHISAAAKEAVLATFQPKWRGKPVLALCPGAEFGPSKRWPESYFAAVAKQKIQDGWDIWFFGSSHDQPLIQRIMDEVGLPCDNFSGRTNLAEAIDLMSLTSGVLTNDSGLMHIAAALKKPLIALYGSTSPAFTPPLSETATVLKLNLPCQPCFQRTCPLEHHRCLRDLTPNFVLANMSEWG